MTWISADERARMQSQCTLVCLAGEALKVRQTTKGGAGGLRMKTGTVSKDVDKEGPAAPGRLSLVPCRVAQGLASQSLETHVSIPPAYMDREETQQGVSMQ